jgi:hypothetical protein
MIKIQFKPNSEYIKGMLENTVLNCDPTLKSCAVSIVYDHHHHHHQSVRIQTLGQSRSKDLCDAGIDLYASKVAGLPSRYQQRPNIWYWPLNITTRANYAVDWNQGPLDYSTVVYGPDFQARFFPGRLKYVLMHVDH